MVLPERIELSTSPLPRECSTTELRQPFERADFCHNELSSASTKHANASVIRETPKMQKKPAGKASSGTKARDQRLAAQLKANVAKRKAQARGRKNEPDSLAKPAIEGGETTE